MLAELIFNFEDVLLLPELFIPAFLVLDFLAGPFWFLLFAAFEAQPKLLADLYWLSTLDLLLSGDSEGMSLFDLELIGLD